MKKRPKVDTFAKLLVMLVVLHGMVMTTLSYVLAGFNHDPVQDVSVAIISEIIAPTVTFMITHVIQNIFEYNKPLQHNWSILLRYRNILLLYLLILWHIDQY